MGDPRTAWAGEFGDRYTARNRDVAKWLGQREAMWRAIWPAMADRPPRSVLEVGANVGINLRALKSVANVEMHALEPNAAARRALTDDAVVAPDRAIDGTADAIALADAAVDMVFTSGVLIHIAPSQLEAAYREMHRVSARYCLSIEYYASEPEEKQYRGQAGLLFKRDFGALWLDLFPDLEIVDYGFFWRPATGLDNLNWWLLRKP